MNENKGGLRRRQWVASCMFLCSVAAILGGCASVKTYPNTLAPNVHIRTDVDSGSFFRSAAAAFDIYRLDAGCQVEHLGRVNLDHPVTDVGMRPDQPSYVEFLFVNKTFLSGNVNALRYDTVLTPRSGYDYDVQLSYVSGLYNVTMRETRKGSSTSRVVERKTLKGACAVNKEERGMK
jgi:hypothetical protein